VRVRVLSTESKEARSHAELTAEIAMLKAEAAAGRPSVLLCDASAKVLCPLPTEPSLAPARKALVEAARAEASVIVRGCEIVLHERTGSRPMDRTRELSLRAAAPLTSRVSDALFDRPFEQCACASPRAVP
jgi:hypothetical protein